jgi:hypothetical protein
MAFLGRNSLPTFRSQATAYNLNIIDGKAMSRSSLDNCHRRALEAKVAQDSILLAQAIEYPARRRAPARGLNLS